MSIKIIFTIELIYFQIFVSWDDENDLVEPEPNPHETPAKELLWAAEEGKTELAEKILKEFPDLVNTKDRDGYTALHKAAYSDHFDLAFVLLKYGADVNARTNMLWTPLHSACKWNNPKIVALLLQNGADINARSEGDQTPLHIACTVSDCRDTLIELFLDDRLDPNIVNNSGETALQIAKRTGPCAPLFEMTLPAFKALKTVEVITVESFDEIDDLI